MQEEGLDDYTVNAVVLPEASVVELFVDGPNPEVSALLANSIGQQGMLFFQSEYSSIYSVRFLDIAETPSSPFTPVPVRDAVVAALLGLSIGAMLAVGYEQFRILLRRRASRKRCPNGSSGGIRK